ncbi:isoprenoid biosynthesis glyoxalase ElbB [Arsenophonus sp. aPb]|uniref:isoprenoid biosynthesis glyoxalase ElbB n=1 Tax=Arsenophonus sp. aPb TaxID=3041619 RepID=UPI002468A706|nr:isoprenoid biosynthesis glyoxalase ElbB [Arsenophonus sp. aPb]WGL98031.1 isoprenoid biosynthesis glyoxalase ElbB [Arsenophonus sp. aPb]
MKPIAVILSGCGVLDGSEIHESVLTMLSLSQNSVEMCFLAPDREQLDVINHINGKEKQEKRNIMVESSRISRGKIAPLASADANKFSAVIIPGGFGVAKNLSNFAIKESNCEIDKDLLTFCRKIHQQGKPMGLMCIAPVMLPKILNKTVTLTIGNDKKTIAQIEKMGGKHIVCSFDDIVVDEDNRVITTPAYMLASSPNEAWQGINKLVKKVIEMASC